MAAQEELITFYDIPSLLSDKAWSPNTWRARYVLNIKAVPYKTKWFPHAAIEPEMRRIGAAKTVQNSTGVDKYTLPAILDPRDGTAVSDSNNIASYIDSRFPEPHPLHVEESLEFVQSYGTRLLRALLPLIAVDTLQILLPESRDTWRALREQTYGMRLEELVKPDEKRGMLLTDVLGALSDINAHSNSTGESPYVWDDALSYRDVVVAATLTWARRVLDVESDIWGCIMEAHGGRWKWLMDRFSEWEIVDGAEPETGIL